MTVLRDPLVEARALARLIEARSHAIASYARMISETPDTEKVRPEEWQVFCNSLYKLSAEMNAEIENFVGRADLGT